MDTFLVNFKFRIVSRLPASSKMKQLLLRVVVRSYGKRSDLFCQKYLRVRFTVVNGSFFKLKNFYGWQLLNLLINVKTSPSLRCCKGAINRRLRVWELIICPYMPVYGSRTIVNDASVKLTCTKITSFAGFQQNT